LLERQNSDEKKEDKDTEFFANQYWKPLEVVSTDVDELLKDAEGF
jgi:hypothetical protein